MSYVLQTRIEMWVDCWVQSVQSQVEIVAKRLNFDDKMRITRNSYGNRKCGVFPGSP